MIANRSGSVMAMDSPCVRSPSPSLRASGPEPPIQLERQQLRAVTSLARLLHASTRETDAAVAALSDYLGRLSEIPGAAKMSAAQTAAAVRAEFQR